MIQSTATPPTDLTLLPPLVLSNMDQAWTVGTSTTLENVVQHVATFFRRCRNDTFWYNRGSSVYRNLQYLAVSSLKELMQSPDDVVPSRCLTTRKDHAYAHGGTNLAICHGCLLIHLKLFKRKNAIYRYERKDSSFFPVKFCASLFNLLSITKFEGILCPQP